MNIGKEEEEEGSIDQKMGRGMLGKRRRDGRGKKMHYPPKREKVERSEGI